MYLKCLENGQFQLLGLLPSVFGVQTAKNEFFQKSFFWTFTTDQNDIQKKGSQYFLRIVTFFCLIPPTPSYIFSIEKRKKSKNRPKRKLKKKIFPQLGILGNFFCVFPWCWRLLFIKNWVVIEQFRVHRFFWQNLLACCDIYANFFRL